MNFGKDWNNERSRILQIMKAQNNHIFGTPRIRNREKIQTHIGHLFIHICFNLSKNWCIERCKMLQNMSSTKLPFFGTPKIIQMEIKVKNTPKTFRWLSKYLQNIFNSMNLDYQLCAHKKKLSEAVYLVYFEEKIPKFHFCKKSNLGG